MLVAVSGPSLSGKSTLFNFLKSTLSEYPNIIYLDDIHDAVWDTLAGNVFSAFTEITKDRDYMYIYIERLVKEYINRVSQDYGEENLVIMDGSYIDVLVYSFLNMWYHYPIVEIQERVVNDLLEVKDAASIIYMTRANEDDSSTSNSLRVKMSNYKRKRPVELKLYDIFRDSKKVVTLPSSSVLGCDFFIKEDLKSRGLLL